MVLTDEAGVVDNLIIMIRPCQVIVNSDTKVFG